MNIAILASGSRGDVQPYIALGSGLQAAGHSVRVVTHANYQSLVAEHGLEFWEIGGDVQAVAQSEEMQRLIESGNFLKMSRKMGEAAAQMAVPMAQNSLAASEGVDVIIGGTSGVSPGVSIAEKLGIPFIFAHLVPQTATAAFPAPVVPPIPAFLNRFSYRLLNGMMGQMVGGNDKRIRANVLALPPRKSDAHHAPPTHGMPVLYGYSPSVLPKPKDWPENIHVTGYWFLEAQAEWQPSAELQAFLAAGSPPVYIGFGSMSNRNPQATTDLVLAALAQTRQRAILMSGWGGMQLTDTPDYIFPIDSIPHRWLFPRTAAVVHHGGVGTTAAGLSAGVPNIVVPFFGDQPFWGRTVQRLGAGPAPIAHKQLSVDNLAAALHSVINDEHMQAQAAHIGQQIQAEDGVRTAVRLIETAVTR